MSGVERKALFARKDLVSKLAEIAEKRGCSLYSLVNEIFEVVIKAEDSGIDFRRVIERESLIDLAKRTGYVLVLESLWYEMIELACKYSVEQVTKTWFDVGVWLATRYVSRDLKDPVNTFFKDLQSFVWDVAELAVKRDKDSVHVRVANPKAPEHYSELMSAFLEGALSTLGYRVVSKEITKEFLLLEAVLEGG